MRPSSKALLAKAGVPALLISNLKNIRYLSGLNVSDGLILALPRGFRIYLDPRYTELGHEGSPDDMEVRDSKKLVSDLKRVGQCGFEENDVTVARLRRWKKMFPNTAFARTSDSVEQFRRAKDAEETRLLKRAGRITDELLRRVPPALRAGITEKALSWKLETWARELGADGLSFEPIVAFGSHTSRPHHRGTQRALRKGDIVQIDVGAKYRGYLADKSAVYFTARLTPQQEFAFTAVNEAMDASINAIRVGASSRAVDKAARDALAVHGLEDRLTHALGHGVGLDIHEGPTFSPRAPDTTLLAGEVFAIEPGVYFPGKFGIRVEDMIFVK
jgi:Xaa-Pro aminopeptidase